MAASRPVGPRPTVRQALRTSRSFRRVEAARKSLQEEWITITNITDEEEA